MLDWKGNLVYIPEIGFGDFATIVMTNSYDLNTSYNNLFKYNKQIYPNGEHILNITITEKDIDKLEDLIEKIINNKSYLNEIIIFIDNYKNVLSYNYCIVNNINIKIEEDYMSMGMKSDINNYVLELNIISKYVQEITSKMYDRKKKLKKIISKLR
jgi:hypothetical protein